MGTAGIKNLEIHQLSKTCKTDIERKRLKVKAKPDHSLLAFFRPRAALNPSTVSAPPPVHAPLVLARMSAVATDSESNLLSQSAQAQAVSKDLPELCLLARGLLHDLSKKMKGIPKTIPLANNDHRLAIFSQDPATCIRPELDDWEDLLNPAVLFRSIDFEVIMCQCSRDGKFPFIVGTGRGGSSGWLKKKYVRDI